MNDYSFQLKMIDVSQIKPNPNNPRGEFVRDNDDQFQYLKRSIRKFGLMVPLVVLESETGNKKYVLLDGERRYSALKELGIKKVPAHVLNTPISPEDGKTLMFHIHTNRVQWTPCMQCKAIEPLYRELKKRFHNEESPIAQELTILTGTAQRTVTARLNFLRWPEDIKEIAYSQRPEFYYHIVEIEAQIMGPALRNFPSYFRRVSPDEVRRFLLHKYVAGKVHAAIEARKVQSIVKANDYDREKHAYALKTFKKLVNDVDYTFENARDDFVAEYPEAANAGKSFRQVTNDVKRTLKTLESLEPRTLSELKKAERQKFIDMLTDLQSAVSVFLEAE